ncbi:STELLO glycosyltransferase family protein [Neobacillus sp. YIM B06451]|uniref:STELLO glycosyltransferase family protein n=1 Tax=Neobacillus sp. YIM B06451 TaxID=3070994 RepID=UPI002931D457|nr:STELLO glycosyltransferase family protein [Neobacillus sp. YIM B06451]
MNRTKNFMIITSIFSPTKAVEKFSNICDWSLIVVGDKKSPNSWAQENTIFLSAGEQKKLDYQLINSLPWNHYCRKMIGYVYAIKQGADYIYDTDDDNIPKLNWEIPRFEGEYLKSNENLGFINIYKSFTEQHIWPRGLPLQLINDYKATLEENSLIKNKSKVGVWQGLADGDPDVDAIYRLTNNEPCIFKERDPIVLAKGTISPFNSQNTAFYKELFPLLYLPAYVTFRFTDILRGLVAQPIMWAAGYELGFMNATVFQERNPHNYVNDFESEIPCYLHGEKVIELVEGSISSSKSVVDNLYNAYETLCNNNIVISSEIEVLSDWLKDIS